MKAIYEAFGAPPQLRNVPDPKPKVLGMAEKAKEFVATGSEKYHSNLPEDVKEHH